MSSVVAIVKSIVGQVFVVSPEGIRRVLVEGDRLFVGDQVDTGAAGAVTLELADGRTLDLGRDTQWSGSAPDSSTDLAAATAQAAPSVEELQQAIAAGADPTKVLEPTAAGPAAAGTGGAAGGGHSFVMLDATAGRVDPTIGFPTEGLDSAAQVTLETPGGQSTNNNANANDPLQSTLSLSATPTITEAGGMLVYTATLSQAPLTDLTITLSNGAVIIVAAGQTTGTVNVPLAPNDTVYKDATQISVTVTGITGGAIVVIPPTVPAVTQVTDTVDTTGLTLTATGAVAEGGSITYTATLTNPAGTPVTVTLSNGSVITIEAGKTTGTVVVETPANDVYVNGSTVSTTITGATGGNFENLVPSTTPAVTSITDSPDTTGLTLTATGAVVEGGSITYTATLTNPAGTPVTVTLSNGSVITIEAGKTTGTVVVETPANDVYVNGSTVSTTITGATGGNFENLVPSTTPAVTSITDSPDTTGVSLTATGVVVEGGSITYTATLTNPAGTPVTVTLSNGSVITIEAGKTTGTVVVETPANDVYVNGSTVSTTITGATGGNFENLVPSTTPAVTTITDSPDTTGLTLTATGAVVEGGSITYTATLTNPAGTPVTVTLSNGSVITIEAGKTTGTVVVETPANDVYVNGSTVSTTITGATGGNFENLVPSTTPAVTSITDSPDTTGLTLTATGAVVEGGSITYTATLTNPAGTPVTVTLSNGSVITIEAGKTTGTVVVETPANDVYVNGSTVSTTITGATGGNFENLVPSTTPAVTIITDSPDTTGLTLTATGAVVEGGSITYTATLTNPAGTPVTVTLSNGSVITIEAGKTTGTVVVETPANDVYVNGSTVSTTITGATGGNFENLVPSTTPAVTTITDSPDTTGLTLTATGAVVEGGSITYTATLTNPAGTPVTVTLSNGSVITIEAGKTTGTVVVETPANDVYVNGSTVSTTITGATGGNFENLVPNPEPAVTQISDSVDKVTVTIESAGNVLENAAPSFIIKVDQKLDHDLTVTLSNGQSVTIAAGSTQTTYALPAQGDDVYKDGESIKLGITTAAVDGQTFENLVIGNEAEVNIGDTTSEVIATLTVDKSSVVEGGLVTYTVTLSNAAGLPISNHGELTFKLTDGTTITVPANGTTGSAIVATTNDVFTGGQPSLVNKLESVTLGGENFEQLTLDQNTLTTTVTDQPAGAGDAVTVTIESAGDVLENGAPTFTIKVDQQLDHDLTVTLSNGQTVVIAAGALQTTYALPAQGDDVYKDGSTVNLGISGATADGRVLENLVVGNPASVVISDTISEVVATLTADKTTVAEGGQITYTVTLTNAAGLPINNHGELTFTLTDGTQIKVPANTTSGSFTITAPDDILVGGQPTIINKLESVSGADNFEKLTLGQNALETTVTDEPAGQDDQVGISIVGNGSVAENQDPSFTIKLDKAQDHALTVTLSNGQTVTFAIGETEKVHTLSAQGDDVYKDGSTVTLGVNGATAGGTALENLVIGNPASVLITDTTNDVVAKLTVDSTSVSEGGQITYTVTLSNADGLPVNNHGGLSFTLTDGTVINIAANQTSGSTSVPVPDNLYVDQPVVIDNQLTGVSGSNNYENLVLDSDTTSVTISDDANGAGNKVTVGITANGDVVEGNAPSFTVSINRALADDFTVTLSNGKSVVISAGQTSAIYSGDTNAEDVYQDPTSQTLNITGASVAGKTFENLVIDNTAATVNTTDTTNDVVAKLTVDSTSVSEGGQITYTVTLSNADGLPVNNHGGLTFTLTDGTTINIAANQTSGSTSVPVPDNLYVDQPVTVVNQLQSVSGSNNYENLVLGSDTTSVTISDDANGAGNKVTVALSANGDVVEGTAPSFTVSINRVLADDFSVTLSNGKSVVITAGQTSAIYTGDTNAEDVYQDPTSQTLHITGAEVAGKSFENLVISGADATVNTTDTTNDVVAKLTVDNTSVSEGGQITYTVTLSNADGLPVNNHGGLSFTLTDGTVINIAANQTSGSISVPVADNLYVDQPVTVVNQLQSVSGSNNYENLVLGSDTTSVTISDDANGAGNKVTVALSANGDVVEGTAPSFTVSINRVLADDFSVTLSNGKSVVITAGQTSAIYTGDTNAEDVYQDPTSQTLHITGAEVAGKSFENLVISGADATVNTTDTTNDVVAKLTVDNTSVSEGGQITYTVTLSNADGLPVNNHGGLTFTLTDGTTINIAANQTSGSTSVPVPDNLYVDQPVTVVNQLQSVSGSNNYENLVLGSDKTSVTISDEANGADNKVTVGIAANGDVTEGTAPTFTVSINRVLADDFTVTLSNGKSVVITAGQTSAIYSGDINAEDVYQDPTSQTLNVTGASVAGKTFENLVIDNTAATVNTTDTTNDVVAKLTVDSTSVSEGGQITYTVTLSNADGLPVNNHGGLTFTLTDGTTINVAANQTSGSTSVPVPNNLYVDQPVVIDNQLTGVSGSNNYENLVLGSDKTSVTISDDAKGDANKVTVGIVANGDVTEGHAPTFTVSINRVLADNLVVSLSNGKTVTITAGQKTAIYSGDVNGEDVYQDPSSQTLNVTGASVAGKTFENLVIDNSTATVNTTDTTNDVVAKLTVDSTSVSEGGQITYTVTLSNADGLPVNNHGGLSFTLTDGTVINIAANQTSGSTSVPVPDNLYVDQPVVIDNQLTGVSGSNNYENLVLGSDKTSVTISDEANGAGNKVTVGIAANGDVVEGNAPSFTVSINRVLADDFTVTLSNGKSVVITAGQTSAIYSGDINAEDVYQDPTSQTLNVTGASVAGKTFENLVIDNSTATVNTTDTTNDVVAKLTVDSTSVSEGGQITYTVTLSNADGLPVNNHGGLTFTLKDGTVINVAANQTSGSTSVPVADNLYVDQPVTVVNQLQSVSGNNNYENLVLGSDKTSVTISDDAKGDANKVTVGIVANGDVTEGTAPTFTVSINRVLADDFTVTLSNGKSVVITAGQTSAIYSGDINAEDVYQDPSSQTLNVTGASVAGKTFENLVISGADATVNTTDTTNDVVAKLTVDSTSVSEGGQITYTVTLSNADGLPVNNHGGLTFTLTDGTTINVAANQTSGSTSVPVADNLYVDQPVTVVNQLQSVSGSNNYENLVLGSDKTSVTISDEANGADNKVTVGIAANGDVTEGHAPSFTVSINRVLADNLVVSLSNGKTVTITAGQKTAIYSGDINGEDVYKDPSSQTLNVTGASVAGKTFENLVIDNTAATVNTTDTTNDVVAKLTVDSTSVSEGGQITYTVTLSNADGLPVNNHGGLSFTLTDGTVINIAANQTSGSTSVPVPDNLYVDQPVTVVNQLQSVSGSNNYESLVLGSDTTSVTISDEANGADNKVTVALSANGDVVEGNAPSFTISINRALADDFTVTLSNGKSVVISAGQTSAIYTGDTNAEDVYQDPSSQTLNVTGASVAGKTFENLVISGADATVNTTDTTNDVVAKLTVDSTSVSEGGQITYTVTLSNADGLPVNNHGGLSFTLTDGTVINIAANQTSGSTSVPVPDNLYVDQPVVIDNQLTGVSGSNNYENLVLDSDKTSVTISDDANGAGNKVTVGIAANGDVVEGNAPSFTISINRALADDFTVTLSNGKSVVITAGQTSAIYSGDINAEDVYQDPTSQTLNVTGASVAGKTFENLVIDNSAATVNTTDTTNDVVAKLTVDSTSVSEGGQITYTVTLSNADGLPVNNHGGLTFTLTDGTTINVAANQTSGSTSVPVPDNLYVDQPVTVVNQLQSVSGSNNYENLVLGSDKTSVTISDDAKGDANKVTVGIVANGDVTEGTAPTFTVSINRVLADNLVVSLSNGKTVTITAGQKTAIYTGDVNAEDVYQDPTSQTLNVTGASVAGKTFENLVIDNSAATVNTTDTTNDVVAKLTVDSTSVSEGGQITYTVTLSNADGLPVNNHGGLTFTLTDGTTINIAANQTSGSTSVPVPDNLYVDQPVVIDNQLTGVTGSNNYENLVLGSDKTSVTISDEANGADNKVTVGIAANGDVTEGTAPTFTVSINRVLADDFTVTLSNGKSVVITAGQTSAIYTGDTNAEDVYQDPSSLTLNVTGASVAGKTFENLVIDNTAATVKTTDTINEVTAKLTVDSTSVSEGGQITYTVTLSNAAGLPMASHGPLEFTLTDGTVVKIPANGTSGTAVVTAKDDIFTGGQDAIVNKLESVSANNFEKLTLGQDQFTTTVTDEPSGQGDKITVSIESNGDVLENAAPKFTVKVDQVLKQDLTVTLSNGDTVVIKAGSTSVPYELKAQGDDVYKDGQVIEVGVSNATVDGKSFENLVLGGKAQVTIDDTLTEVKATLTVDKTTVAEGGQITYTVTLTNAAGLPMTSHGPLEFTLTDGTVVKIPANGTSGTAVVTAK
ncbi:UNVERIFIED_ORG: surface adhesion protein, partial [Pseudomonas mohnii]|nr:surface adhesion protein [Pseudomonas mohnii]